MKLHSGLLNQKIGIYNQINTDDGYGGAISEDVLYWQTSAQAEVLSASRKLEANQEQLKPAAVFTVRYRKDKFIDEDMTVLWKGERWTILSAKPDFTYGEFLVIKCRAQGLPHGTAVTPVIGTLVDGVLTVLSTGK